MVPHVKVRDTVALLAGALVVGVACDALSERSGAKCACGALPITVASAKSTPATAAKKPAPKAVYKVIVTYFHSAARCTTCMTIEAWIAKALQDNFGADIKAGRVKWRVVNMS